ncbi:MAG: hypothetical protein ACQCN4_12305 [Candidatus Bathyarchaeia archaeon]
MSHSSKQIQETFPETIIITSDAEPVSVEKTLRICWNTGEEKNCTSCYLRKGCKARE